MVVVVVVVDVVALVVAGAPVVPVGTGVAVVVVVYSDLNGFRVAAANCSVVGEVVLGIPIDGPLGPALIAGFDPIGAAVPESSLLPDTSTNTPAPPATSSAATPTTGIRGMLPNLPAKPAAGVSPGGGVGWLMRRLPLPGPLADIGRSCQMTGSSGFRQEPAGT